MTGGLASAALTAEQQAVYDAVMAKLEESGGKHYISVTPVKKEQTAGSNYDNDGAKGDGGIAIGEDATSQGRGIAMGYKSRAVPKTGATANPNAFEGIAIGQEADMEVPGGIAIGLRSKVEGTLNTKDGNVNELGTIALGTDSYAKGLGAAAFGWKAKGIGEGAMAFGTETEAKESGTAFGGHATAAAGGVAMGWQAHANDRVATSVGTSSDAAKQATAVGAGTTADGIASTAVGLGAVSKGVLSTALGGQSVAEEANSIALGAGSVANTKAGAVGYIATGSSATFEEALVTLNKKEDYDKWTAKVNESKAEYENLTNAFNDAPTKDKKAEAKAALDAWKGQHADFIEALTAKEKLEATWKATKAAVSVGADGVDKAGNRIIESRQITNVAAGTRDTDAVNVAQLKALNTKVEGNKIHYLSIGPDNEKNLAKDGNYNNDGADSHWGIAIGVNASSKGGGSIAIGKGSQAHGTDEHTAQGVSIGSASRAIGAFATAVGHDTKAFGERSVAYGLGGAYGRGSIAIGSGAVAALKEGITKEEYNKLSDEEKAWYGKADYDDQKTFYQFRQKGKDGKVEDIKNYGMAIGSGATSFDNAGLAVGLNAKTNKDFGVAIGGYSENKVEQEVALGTSSVADREKGSMGYLPTTGKAIENFEEAMKATGKETAFKELEVKYLAAQEKFTKAQEAYKADQSPTNMMNLDKAKKELEGAKKEYNIMTAPWTSRRGAVSVGNDKTGFTRQITGVAAGSEDTDAVNVAQLKALDNKVTDQLKDAGAIHYYSVTSDKKAVGSNFDNDGAKAADSMVIGIGSSSEAQNSTVVGNNNTLKRHITDKNGSLSLNNIVVGQSLEVEGAYNAVFGTDYQNNLENRKTMVAGKYNTVIGVGNLAGYTAEKDPQDRNKWIYSKVEEGSDSGNVVVGMNNTATRNSLVIGSDSEATSLGISVGHHNKVVSDEDFGVALGSNLVVDGYQALAIGSESKATADWATAIGQKAIAEKEGAIAIGSETKAIIKDGVALGSYSVADRAKGVTGYLAGENTSEIWKSTRGAVSVGNKEKKYTRQIIGVAAGSEDTDAVNVAQLKVVNTKVDKNTTDITELTTKIKNAGGVHYFSVKADDSKKPADTNWNNDGAKGNNAIAIGQKAKSEGYAAVAMGASAHTGANAHYSLALGMKSDAAGFANIALGNEAKAQAAMYATAIGQEAAVTKNQGIAIGTTAKTDAENGISFGTQAQSLANRGIAVGTNSTVGATGGRGIAIGDGSYVGAKTQKHPGKGMPNPGDAWNPSEPYLPTADDTVAAPGKLSEENAMAIGMKASAFGFQTTALGAGAEAHDTNTTAVGAAAVAKGNYSTALGKQARTYDKESTSVGHWADSRAEFATALGSNTIVYKKGGVALGFGARAYDENSIAIGSNSFAKEAIDGKAYLSDEEVKAAAGIVSVGNPAYKAGDKDVAANYRRIVNVAGGINDNDAVNVAQLKVVNEKADKNATDITNLTKTVNANGKATKVMVDGKEEKADGNLKIKKTEKDGQLTYDLSLNDELVIGKDGKDGKIGINGKDGISAEITVGKGEPGVDGKDGETTTRIVYKDKDGKDHEVATLDDGLKFKGDNDTVVTRKLNQRLDIKGGITNAADLSENNIGVVGTQDGGMAVKLSKNLKGLTSAEFKDGDNITNITAGDISITKKAGDKTETLNIWDLKEKVDAGGKPTKVMVDGKETKADGNLKITKTEKDGQLTYDLSLNDELVIGKDGKDGKIGINGKDGISAEITVGKGEPGVDGKDGITRIIYKDKDNKTHEVATLDDGLKFKGDNDAVVMRKLNTQLNITGGITDAKELSDNNIGVVGTAGDNGGMAVKLSKNLKGLTSAEFKDGDNITNITAGDISITKKAGDKTETFNIWELKEKVDAGGKPTKVMVDGKENKADGNLKITKKEKDGQATYDISLSNQLDLKEKGSIKLGDHKKRGVVINGNEIGVLDYEKNENSVVISSKAGIAVGNPNSRIQIKGDRIDMGGKNIYNLKDGEISETSKQAVNGSQLHATNTRVTNLETKVTNIETTVNNIDQKIEQKIEGAKITVKGDDKTGVKVKENTGADGKVTGYEVSLEEKVKVGNVTIDGTTDGTNKKGEITGLTNTTLDGNDFATKGRAATEEQLKAAMGKAMAQSRTTVKGSDNIAVTPKTESASEYTVELAKDINVNSVTANEYKVGDKTYINDKGINANGNKIINVGDGKISKDSTDAVNGKQLYGVEQKVNQNTTNINKLQNNIYDMGMKVGELDTRVNKVGAGAAALAALHPQDFDPEDKWDIAAGVGNYKNATAAAVGLFYRPNERTMLNLGWTMGDSRNMVNAGVSVKLGSGSTYAGLSKVQMATRLTQQEEKITAQEQEIKELREREEQREKQIQEILSKLEMIEKAKA